VANFPLPYYRMPDASKQSQQRAGTGLLTDG
jgi:hypothetical protein